ncbi:MAG: hypothetical protein ABSA57_02280 [Candidatus Acidiferrales bacterium]|jgi:hypothetical protein
MTETGMQMDVFRRSGDAFNRIGYERQGSMDTNPGVKITGGVTTCS